jgi:hypothetical protein
MQSQPEPSTPLSAVLRGFASVFVPELPPVDEGPEADLEALRHDRDELASDAQRALGQLEHLLGR